MDAHLLARSAARCHLSSTCRRASAAVTTYPLAPSSSTTSFFLPLTARRHKSTTNRTKRALNIAPHPSFLSPQHAKQQHLPQQQGDHIIFNPPASAASVYHTPFKFLPKSDPRRRANLTHLFAESTTLSFSSSSAKNNKSSGSSPPSTFLPPRVEHDYYTADKYHLKPEDVAEIRRLRAEDPEANSVIKLARAYNCSPLFVMMAVKSSAEHKAKKRTELQERKEKWGPKKTAAREDRRKRIQMILKGEL